MLVDRCPIREPNEIHPAPPDRKSTRLNSSHSQISYAVFCLKKKKHSARLQEFRNDGAAEMIERHLVAEEEGLVGGHVLYHLCDKGSRASPPILHEVGNPRQA